MGPRRPTTKSEDILMAILFYAADSSEPTPEVPWLEEFSYGTVTGDPIDETYWELSGDPYPEYLAWNGRGMLRLEKNSGSGQTSPMAWCKLTVDGDFTISLLHKWLDGVDYAGAQMIVRTALDYDYAQRLWFGGSGENYYGYWKAGSPSWTEDGIHTSSFASDEGRIRMTRSGSTWKNQRWNGATFIDVGSSHTIGTGLVEILISLGSWSPYPYVQLGIDWLEVSTGTLYWRA